MKDAFLDSDFLPQEDAVILIKRGVVKKFLVDCQNRVGIVFQSNIKGGTKS
jgi:hypothetical protein